MTSIVTSIITALALVLVAVINGIAAIRQKNFEMHLQNNQKQIEERDKREEEREKNQQESTKLIVGLLSVNTDLSVATAKAVQNIPEAKADGEITAAVAVAVVEKKKLTEFLNCQGIKNIYEK